MSTERISPEAGWLNRSKIKHSASGQPLCRRCGQEIPERSGRRTFCSPECVHQWKLRSDPTYVRAEIYKRDHGRCAMCHMDTSIVRQALKELQKTPWRPPNDDLFQNLAFRTRQFLQIPHRSELWDADHVTAVKLGGGECGLDGYQTLCIWCHWHKTKQDRKAMKHIKKVES